MNLTSPIITKKSTNSLKEAKCTQLQITPIQAKRNMRTLNEQKK